MQTTLQDEHWDDGKEDKERKREVVRRLVSGERSTSIVEVGARRMSR